MKPKLCLYIAFLAVLSHSICLSQGKIKFGEVTLEELKLSKYAADSSAHAVILSDRGRLEGNTGRFTRHVRVKIIDHAGTGYANFQIRTPSKSDIDGITFNLENGRVVEHSLDKDNIFKEEIIKGFTTYKLFMPNVKPGSIIDLRYSFFGVPFEWRFQEKIPVAFSEVILEPTQFIQFKKTLYGTHPVKNQGIKWTVTNVPAFVEEPYMCDYSNYLTHLKIDLEHINLAGYGLFIEFSADWRAVGKRLLESRYFGEAISNTPFLNDKADELKQSTAPAAKKIEEAYAYIQENIKYNGWESHVISADYWANFKKNHSGNCAEVNLALVGLLQKSGLTAFPAIMSTRNNGLLNQASASMNAINYVVAYVEFDGSAMLLDATDADTPAGVLPLRSRNVLAYVVKNAEEGMWVDTSIGKSHVKKQTINIKPDADGRFIADLTESHEDYAFLEWLTQYKKFDNDDSYKRSVMASAKDTDIINFSTAVDKQKMKASETRTLNLSGTDIVQDLGDEVILNLSSLADIKNPFNEDKRAYPIDFRYPFVRTVVFTMKIPEKYSLRQVPDAKVFRPESGGAKFSYVSSLSNNFLTIKCTLQVERQIFTENEYSSLKHFFSEANRKISTPLILDKKT